MKNIIILSIGLLICFSCKKKDITPTIKSETLNPELYGKILEFQNDIKIQNSYIRMKTKRNIIKSALIHVYEIKFYLENKDTIVSFTLYSDGINSYYNKDIQRNEKIYGIYEDDTLKPTYINDPHKIGSNFIKKYIENPKIVSKFYKKNDFINDEIYDIYLYKVKGHKMILYDILHGNKK